MVILSDLAVAVWRGGEVGHLEEVDVVLPSLRREEEGARLEVLGDRQVVVPQVPVAERRDLSPLVAAVVLRLSSETKQNGTNELSRCMFLFSS